ncbi:MAG: hypothetical protein KF864_04940 [Phycisphaeraceae bacterium]|nr:hypothetical protein [Phycisphaeraceae bacterium]
MLRLDGFRVNFKRVHRLWRRRGLPECPRSSTNAGVWATRKNGIVRRRATKDHVWCVDFIYDRDERDRQLKCLSVIDEFTRSAWRRRWTGASPARTLLMC